MYQKVAKLNKQKYRDYVINEIMSPTRNKDTFGMYRHIYVAYPQENSQTIQHHFNRYALAEFRKLTWRASDGIGLTKAYHGNIIKCSRRDIRIPLHRYRIWRVIWKVGGFRKEWYLSEDNVKGRYSTHPFSLRSGERCNDLSICGRGSFADKTIQIVNYLTGLRVWDTTLEQILGLYACTRRSGFAHSSASYLSRFWKDYGNCPKTLR
jgi:hypothetical protein